MREFVTAPSLGELDAPEFLAACDGLAGVEVFAASIAPRTGLLPAGVGREALIARLRRARAFRLHASYWGSPTAFLGKIGHAELRRRFASEREFLDYFGDGSGRHQFSRWVDEYRLARDLGAETYVFHMIDYATIDGAWEFEQSREEVLAALSAVLQQLLLRLEEAGLLADGPLIELENAGWGLEYGMQTANDAVRVLDAVDDPRGSLRIGWDLNHLLHALGADPGTGRARFLLPDDDLDDDMRELADQRGDDLLDCWLESQLCDPRLRGRISSVHVSDCALKSREFFRRGRLIGDAAEEQRRLPGTEQQRDFGLSLVLDHYDSHLPLGRGCLDGERLVGLLHRLDGENPGFAVLHELKLSRDVPTDLAEQRRALGWDRA